jgi:core-2/I-Branching enzyme
MDNNLGSARHFRPGAYPSMKIAFLVMTHENPQLLRRMIRTLSSNDDQCAFYIHLDRKTDSSVFPTIAGRNVQFVERLPVYWGEYSQMNAILSLMRTAIGSSQHFDYCVLITGSCYPLRSGGYIKRMFESNYPAEYMDIVKVPGPGKPIARFHVIRYPHEKPIRRFSYRALAKIGLARRDYKNYLGALEPYAGDGAWALTRDACQYALDYLSSHPRLETYFRTTFAPDEALLHTVLGNSTYLSRMRRNPVYAIWPGPENGHPAMIDHEHVDFFDSVDQVCGNEMYGAGELVFARKFNDKRMEIVDRIDKMIERKERISLPEIDDLVSASGASPQ